MTLNLTNAIPQTLKGPPVAAPIKTCSARQGGPTSFYADIDWSLYGGSIAQPTVAVALELTGILQVPMDAIRSVYIDNTFSYMPVYVQFPDTGFVVVCEPFSTATSYVFTNVLSCFVVAEGISYGRPPKTRVILSNVDRDGFSLNPGVRQATEGQLVSTSFDIFSPAQLNFNFAATNVGPAANDRIICTIITASSIVALPTFTSLTLGGVPLTTGIQATYDSGPFKAVVLLAYRRVMEAGTTMALAGTVASPIDRIDYASYRINGALNFAPDSASAVSAVSGNIPGLMSPITSPTSFGCFGGCNVISTGSSEEPFWHGVDYDAYYIGQPGGIDSVEYSWASADFDKGQLTPIMTKGAAVGGIFY